MAPSLRSNLILKIVCLQPAVWTKQQNILGAKKNVTDMQVLQK